MIMQSQMGVNPVWSVDHRREYTHWCNRPKPAQPEPTTNLPDRQVEGGVKGRNKENNDLPELPILADDTD